MPFELSPQKLVYGGEALGYHHGRTVLVPRALPGERLEVEAVRIAKGVVHARPLRILQAAPERVDPPCPYFGRCGGCQYQHLSPERQATAKREILRETLRRIGKIIWEGEIPVHAAHPWNYRNQARLKIAHKPDGKVELGFFEAESHRLFPVDACLILSPRLNAILAELRGPEWSSRLAHSREVELLADDRDERVMLTLRGDLVRDEVEALARDCLAWLPGVESVVSEQGRSLRVFGKPVLTYRVGEFQYQISPGSFFQASRYLLPKLVAAVAGLESRGRQAPDRRSLALDLFAGVGLFTLPLAKEFDQVVAAEAQPEAAVDLAANAAAHGLKNIRAVRETAYDFLRRFAQSGADFVVLDPPRAGVGASTLKFLTALSPRQILYVSCHPSTLARDLNCLAERGYRINSIELFDFFPQTFHIESLAHLTRREE